MDEAAAKKQKVMLFKIDFELEDILSVSEWFSYAHQC